MSMPIAPGATSADVFSFLAVPGQALLDVPLWVISPRLLASSLLLSRRVLGFPDVGAPYWLKVTSRSPTVGDESVSCLKEA